MSGGTNGRSAEDAPHDEGPPSKPPRDGGAGGDRPAGVGPLPGATAVAGAGVTTGVEVSTGLSAETLMRYLDGEMSPDERRRVEELLSGATELQRELVVYRHIHEDLSEIRLRTGGGRRSVWERVNQRLTRPMGWIFLCAGVGSWAIYLAWIYLSSATPTWEKVMSSAVVIGILLLLASVIHDRYREWLSDPYRDVER